MAAKDNIRAPTNLKITKWKVRKESHVFKGTVLALYSQVSEEIPPSVMKLKASFAGIVEEIEVKEGGTANEGDVLLKLSSETSRGCSHPTIMKDMCADCGMDLRETLGLPGDRKTSGTASVAMVHSIPELIVSEEQAMEIGKIDENRLLRQKKLVLLVDLDQTLIHTTNDNVPPNLKDVKHFQLWHGRSRLWYHTRFRPFTQRFIEAVSKMYELHICTFGVRMYAHIIARLLDPDKKYFSHRILSRDECFDAMSKTANLKALFPCGDKTVCIIDDREDVWNFAPNLVHVKPYRFFQGTADINAPPGLTKKEHDSEPLSHKVVDSAKQKGGHEAESAASQDKNLGEKREGGTTKEGDQKIGGENVIGKSEDGDTITDAASKSLEAAKEKSCVVAKDDVKSCGDGAPAIEKCAETTPSNTGEAVVATNTESDVTEKNESERVESLEVKEETADSSKSKVEVEAKKGSSGVTTNEEKKEEEEIDWEDTDDYLLHLEEILTRIHTAFYDLYEQSVKKGQAELPDLKSIVPYVRRKILKGTNIVFSGMVPLNMPLEKSKAYIVATALGAVVQTDLVPPDKLKGGQKDPKATTHLVAAKSGTGKHRGALKMKGVKIVQGDWLWACSERWEWVEESLYPLNNSDFLQSKNDCSPAEKFRSSSKSRPQKRDSSSVTEGGEASSQDQCATKRLKLEDCSSELVTPLDQDDVPVSPVVCFSDAELQSMDKEVNDLLEDESSSESEEERDAVKLREKVLGISEESESDDSLSGDFPRGWGIRKKSFKSSEEKDDVGEKARGSDVEDDDETENELERYQKNITAFAGDDSSTSASDDSIGSVDDEIADAVEREFLGS